MTIIGLLSSVILTSVTGAQEKARITKVRLEAGAIRTEIILLADDTDLWPCRQTVDQVLCGGASNEIEDLTTGNTGLLSNDGTFSNWGGPYANEIPLDPWGNNYFFDTDYELGGGRVVAAVGSYGPDGYWA